MDFEPAGEGLGSYLDGEGFEHALWLAPVAEDQLEGHDFVVEAGTEPDSGDIDHACGHARAGPFVTIALAQNAAAAQTSAAALSRSHTAYVTQVPGASENRGLGFVKLPITSSTHTCDFLCAASCAAAALRRGRGVTNQRHRDDRGGPATQACGVEVTDGAQEDSRRGRCADVHRGGEGIEGHGEAVGAV